MWLYGAGASAISTDMEVFSRNVVEVVEHVNDELLKTFLQAKDQIEVMYAVTLLKIKFYTSSCTSDLVRVEPKIIKALLFWIKSAQYPFLYPCQHVCNVSWLSVEQWTNILSGAHNLTQLTLRSLFSQIISFCLN